MASFFSCAVVVLVLLCAPSCSPVICLLLCGAPRSPSGAAPVFVFLQTVGAASSVLVAVGARASSSVVGTASSGTGASLSVVRSWATTPAVAVRASCIGAFLSAAVLCCRLAVLFARTPGAYCPCNDARIVFSILRIFAVVVPALLRAAFTLPGSRGLFTLSVGASLSPVLSRGRFLFEVRTLSQGL